MIKNSEPCSDCCLPNPFDYLCRKWLVILFFEFLTINIYLHLCDQRHFEKSQEQHEKDLERREREEEEEYQKNLAKTLNQLPTSCREERKARVD